MKLMTLFFLLTGQLALATPLASEEVFEKLKALAMKAEAPTVFKAKTEISVTLPTEKPRGDEKQEWINSYAKAFVQNEKTVKQITIETENCHVTESQLDKSLMQERMKEIVQTVSSQLFGKPFDLDGERYFKELGPFWQKSVHVKIRESHPGVRSMRLSRGISKCDARGGFRFRYDFFL